MSVSVLLLISLLSICAPVFGDLVEMTNGDRMSGELKSLNDGKLAFDTTYAGELRIDWKRVARLSTSEAYDVEFVSGRIFSGVISSDANGRVEIRSATIETALHSEIVAIRPRPEQPGQLGILDNWHGAMDVGYTVTQGNTDSTQAVFQFQPERKTNKDRIRADLQSLYGRC